MTQNLAIHYKGSDWGVDYTFAPELNGAIVPHIWGHIVPFNWRKHRIHNSTSNVYRVVIPEDWCWVMPVYTEESVFGLFGSGSAVTPTGTLNRMVNLRKKIKSYKITNFCWCGCGSVNGVYNELGLNPVGCIAIPKWAIGAHLVNAPRGCGITDQVKLIQL